MSTKLSKIEIVKFSRQIILKNIGALGQRKIQDAKVLIIGMGGLGCPAAEFLTRSGIGTLGIVDHDRVSLSNIHRQTLYQRSIIVAAGPFANFLLAIFIFAFIYMFAGKDFTPAQIQEVQAESPAEEAGIKPSDIIQSINGKDANSIMEVSAFINSSSSEIIDIGILRNESEITFSVKPEVIKGEDTLGNKANKKIIGIKIAPLNDEINRERLGPATALFYAFKETWFVIDASWNFIISMFKGTGDTTQLGGPIKIAKITGQVAKMGFIAFLSIMAYISISLGFINLLPIPMLDGGHLMFYAFEKVLGRPLTQKTQEGFFRIGLFLLLSLMFFTTFNDLKDLGLF